MAKFCCTVFLLLTINFGIIYVRGQSTVGECNNDDKDIADDLSRFIKNLSMRNTDAWVTLTKSVESVLKDHNAQIAHLENRMESHNTYMSNSVDEIKRQLRIENMEMKNEFQGLIHKLPSRHCPEGFRYGAAGFPKCYAVLNDTVDWNTAQNLNYNAQLVVINSSREQQIITELLLNHECKTKGGQRLRYAFWTGARRRNISDCNSPLQWTSSNGLTHPITYSNWNRGEPNCERVNLLGQREACAAIDMREQFAYKWNDMPCDYHVCPLCEVTVHG
jgi:hypothetical protein